MSTMSTVADNFKHLRDEINRRSVSVILLAVSKYQPVEKIVLAINAGQNHFGENKVQEALTKWSSLKETYPHIELHMIGALQTNKVADAVSIFDVIQSVDRTRLVDAIAKEMNKQHKSVECYIQVNIGNEPQKSGVLPENFGALLAYARKQGVTVTGVMCIPPADENPRRYFKQLKQLADNNKLPHVSMGMSSDYQIAIEEGATCIRVGTAIFGARDA